MNGMNRYDSLLSKHQPIVSEAKSQPQLPCREEAVSSYLFLCLCLGLLRLHGSDLVPALGGVPLCRFNGHTQSDNVTAHLLT